MSQGQGVDHSHQAPRRTESLQVGFYDVESPEGYPRSSTPPIDPSSRQIVAATWVLALELPVGWASDGWVGDVVASGSEPKMERSKGSVRPRRGGSGPRRTQDGRSGEDRFYGVDDGWDDLPPDRSEIVGCGWQGVSGIGVQAGVGKELRARALSDRRTAVLWIPARQA